MSTPYVPPSRPHGFSNTFHNTRNDARINAIEFIVSSDKLIKMVNFKLGNDAGHLGMQDTYHI